MLLKTSKNWKNDLGGIKIELKMYIYKSSA